MTKTEEKDRLLRDVWTVMRQLSDTGDLSSADLDVWEAVTNHPAIQARLEQKPQN